jgi:hypothetical protein
MSKIPTKKPKATANAKAPARTKPTREIPAPASSKSETIRGLLERRGGASITELSEATGWQTHSVRGFLSGTLRKKLGLTLISAKEDGGRRYRLEPGSDRP